MDDKDLAIRMVKLGIDLSLQLLNQRRDALSLAVSVLPRANCFKQALFDWIGSIEVRLPDAEVDRVLHLCRKVKDFSNSRSVNEVHPVSDPVFRHVRFHNHRKKEKSIGPEGERT